MTDAVTSTMFVGIDLGGTKLHAAAGDAAGRIHARITMRTTLDTGVALIAQLAAITRDVLDRAGASPDALAGVGVGGAGVPTGGTLRNAPNLGEVATVDIVDQLRNILGCPVVLENDVNVAALGELAAGIGREEPDFAVVAVGTGIGMGLVLDGALVRGAQGAAGEIGYLPIGTDPLDARNQRRGPLEEVVAGDAIAARYAVGVTTEDLFARAADGDQNAASALADAAKWIAFAIASIEAVANPGRFVLAGGIGSRPEMLELIRGWLVHLGLPDLPVTTSTLGADAAVLGALCLAREHADRSFEGARS